jgi:hypothetical protein
MAGKNTAAFGIFSSRSAAEACVDALLAEGFRSDDVSVLAPDKTATRELATEKNTKAPEGTTTGATTGGVVGGTLGLLAGIGALAIPGLGPFIAAGPIMGALAGLGAGAAAGGLIGALVGMGIPEYEAKRYEGRVKDGGILVSVHCDDSDWVGKAKDILKRSGAEDVSSAGEKAVSSHGVGESTADKATSRERAYPQVRDTVRRTEAEVEQIGGSANDYTSDFRRHYETQYASSGLPYETVGPAYDYGYRSANDPRYRGRNWSDVENDLRTDYERNQPTSSWEKTKEAVRYGWEKVTGKR